MSRILVTGATGFIGQRFLRAAAGHEVVAAVRGPETPLPAGVSRVTVGPITATTRWTEALVGVDAIVHLASRVHVMRESAPDPLSAFREVNVSGTERLAAEASTSGVRRLVFVSSVKVNGEATGQAPFTESDPPAPADPYGRSKLEAEQLLRSMASGGRLEVTIVRPPLVYGPGVRGNLLSMMRWIEQGLPLPLGAVHNQRSLVAVDALADLLLRCVVNPVAAGQLYLAADAEPIATPDLIRAVAEGMGLRPRLLPLPPWLLRTAGRLTGRMEAMGRLLGSLVVDSRKARRELGWEPAPSAYEGLRAMGAWYRRAGHHGRAA